MSWENYERLLALALRSVEERVRLIITVEGENTAYVQFAGDRAEFAAEASGYHPSVSHVQLSVLGWEPGFSSHENPSVTLHTPLTRAAYDAIAHQSVVTLRDIFHAPSPAALTYRAWRDAE